MAVPDRRRSKDAPHSTVNTNPATGMPVPLKQPVLYHHMDGTAMNTPIYRLGIMLCVLTASIGAAAQAPHKDRAALSNKWIDDPAALRPFWLSDTMRDESLLFVRRNGDTAPKASLLFVPERILSVRSASGAVTYEAGRDYIWKPGSHDITLPEGSRIVWKTPQDLRRPAGTQQFALTHRDGNGEILFGASHEYHDMQTVITYRHRKNAWKGPTPSFAGDRLPRTLSKLRSKQPLTIAMLGDSISTGCNASGWAKVPPFQPPFQDLLTAHLRRIYNSEVTLHNFAVGGTDTAWGLSVINQVIDANPDLVILAFGMNDSGGRTADSYAANMRAMMDTIRKARPDAEFILIASMLGNRDWIALHHDVFPQYRDALEAMCGPGIVMANMTDVWAEVLHHKEYWDITGNGVNHPNDFGHRLYAQVLSALLIKDPMRH